MMPYRNFVLLFVGLCSLLFLLQFTTARSPVKHELSQTITPPLGLPPIPWPEDNPYTKEKAELGRLLYFDKRLSADHTISCAHCHSPPCGYSDCRSVSIGINQKIGTRNSPTIINTAYSTHLFWDGRASSLEEQCIGPIGNPKEMANTEDVHKAHTQCEDAIKNIEGYQILFKNAFGHADITLDDIAKAISTFERSLLSGNSPYDRYMAGDKSSMSQEQIKGFQVFKKSSCAFCHSGPNFSSNFFDNIGVGMDAANPDLGRYEITKLEKDWGAFKVPTLREAEHTGPFMHDGSLPTLESVIDYYDRGGIKNKNLHPQIRPLNLTPEDKANLLSFLKALNGEGWQHFEEPDEYPK